MTGPDLARRARALDQVDSAVVIADLDGVILDWTDGATRLFGWTPDEAIGRKWDDLVGPAASDPDPRRIELRDRRDAGESYRGEMTVRIASGERIPILVDGGPIRDERGAIIGSINVALDDRRRSAAEERFETAFRAGPIASAITSLPRHLILDVNPAFETMSGYDRHQAVGRTATELGLWKTLATRGDVLERTAKGEAVPELATQMQTAAGVTLEVRLSGRPIAAADGPAYLWMAIDDTAEVRTQGALRATASRLEAIVEASPMAIIVVDLELRIELFNPAAEALFGWSAEEVVGQPSPLQAADPGAALELVAGVLKGATVRRDEVVVLDRGGRERTVTVAAAPVHDETGAVTGALAMLADVSERAQLQAQLREAQKMESIGFLAGGIAHDFNNIMTTVGGYAAMATDALGPGHPVVADLEEITHATIRATALTRQLLTFSRRQVTRPTTLDLAAEVDDLQPTLRRVLGEDIELRVEADRGTAWVSADAGQIRQVLVALAVNAREAMLDGGTLHVTVERIPAGQGGSGARAGEVRLVLRDTGHGMDQEVASHAFEPFYTTKPPGQGTGLGLAVVHGIVAGAGGRVEMASQPGAGATFTITFPGLEPAISPATDPPAGGAAGSADSVPASATILVVEDEPTVRSFACRILVNAGYRVVEAEDGVAALESAAGLPAIDLLLTDLTMPRLGGVALAVTLIEQRPGLPVVYMSGFGEDRLAEGGVLDPSVRLLSKPFTAAGLTDAVSQALDEARRA